MLVKPPWQKHLPRSLTFQCFTSLSLAIHICKISYGRYEKVFLPNADIFTALLKQQQQIVWSGSGGVQDRTIYEDSVLPKKLYDAGLMEERDYNTYCELFQNLSNFMKKPNIIVHLDLSPEESYRRIQMRNRDCESGISVEYLRGLHKAYEEFINEIARIIPVIKVDYSRFRTPAEMASAIKREYQKIANIRNVTFNDKQDNFSINDEKGTTPSKAVLQTSQAQSPSSGVIEE